MGLYRFGENKEATPIRSVEPESESFIEELLENNPNIIFGEKMMVLGRQIQTSYGTTVDVLGLNAEGNVVIIELKKGKTPREVITQLLEYGVWAEKELDYDKLNEIAHSKGKIDESESLM